MVLVLRPDDHKVLSISRKKVYCHELMYAKFDPDTQSKPQIDFKDFTLDADEIDCAIRKAKASKGNNDHVSTASKDNLARAADGIPSLVLSVKSMSDSKRNQHLLFPEQREIPAQMVKIYHDAEGSGESGKFEVPETLKFQRDLLLEDIARRKTSQLDDTLSESILKVIQKSIKKSVMLLPDECLSVNLSPSRLTPIMSLKLNGCVKRFSVRKLSTQKVKHQ
jgi:hypothetical protein